MKNCQRMGGIGIGIGIGWYGPLIDLSKVSAYIGDHVQLLLFIHNTSPLQYKLSKGLEVIRNDIQVGDDTRPYFSVSLWQKEMGSMVFSGAIVFLQNVKITKFHDIVEARTVQCSSLQCLVHPEELNVSKDANDIIGVSRTGVQRKEKLKKVIEWVTRVRSSIHDASSHRYHHKINWRVDQERISQDCFSLLQVLQLDKSRKVNFLASVGEIFIPTISRLINETEDERMFVSRRLFITRDKNLVEDLICNGCQLCGAPLDPQSSTSTRSDQSALTLYCQNNSKLLHKISTIYRPFMLYVWDDSNCIPLLVKNKTAELIFGNLKAETVHSCYERRKDGLNSYSNKGEGTTYSDPNFYLIWLILVKVLVQQGKNSPLKFKVEVDVDRDIESGRFELVSLSMPCFGTEL